MEESLRYRPAMGPGCVLIRPGDSYTGAQGLSYGAGLTGATAGARGLCLTEAVLPPGACSRAHLHRGIETGGYVIEGTLETLWGGRLEHSLIAQAGELVYIPPDMPHIVRNPSAERPARALVAHTAPDDQQGIELLPDLDALVR
jgi:uncharacterized RmlC-like cupin family protein